MPPQSSTARVVRLDEHRARVRRVVAAPADLADEGRPRPEPRVFVAALVVSAALHVVVLVSAGLTHHLIHHETVLPKVLEVSLPEPPKPEPAVAPPPKQPAARPQRAEPAARAPVPTPASPPPTPVMAVPETASAQPVTVAPPVERRPEPPPPAPAAAPVTAPVFNAAYLRNPPPGYPMTARRLGQQGLVLLEVHVGTDGRAEQVKLGRTSGHTALDEAAISAVKGWTFVPARRGAEPVPAWVEVPVRFRLDAGE